MPDSADYGAFAVDLNGGQISPFNQLLAHKQQQDFQTQMRQDAINERNQARLDKENEKAEYARGNALDGYTKMDLTTPIQDFNEYKDKEVSRLLKKYSSPEYSNMPVGIFKNQLAQDWGNLISGSEKIKQSIKTHQAAIAQMEKDDPSIDGARIMNDTYGRIKSDYLTQDKDGNTIFKAPDAINPNPNHALDLFNEDYKVGKYVSQKARDKWLEEKASTKGIEPSAFKRKYADGTIGQFTKVLTPFETVNVAKDANNYVKDIPKSEIVSEQGRIDPITKQPVKALPLDLMTSRFLSTPSDERIFNSMYYKHAAEVGLPQKEIDNPLNKQIYAYELLSHHLGSGSALPETHITPAPANNKTNINLSNNAAVENNSGFLREHLDDAIAENPKIVWNPQTKQKETWGILPNTSQYKTKVFDTASGRMLEVPFDELMVSPDHKVQGIIYERDKDDKPTTKHKITQVLPIKDYASKILKDRTSSKNRGLVVDDNVNDLESDSKSSPVGNTKQKVYKGIDKNGNPIFE